MISTLTVENIDLFQVNAAVHVPSNPNKYNTPVTLFVNPLGPDLSSEDSGICRTFGSETTKNSNKNKLRDNPSSNKIKLDMDGLIKDNNYWTLLSIVFTRTLELSRAL